MNNGKTNSVLDPAVLRFVLDTSNANNKNLKLNYKSYYQFDWVSNRWIFAGAIKV